MLRAEANLGLRDEDLNKGYMMKQTNVITASLTLLLAVAGIGHAQLPVMDGLELWLDATDADSVTVDGDLVDEWLDKSGNDYHAYPLADSLVEYATDGPGGLPAIRFFADTLDGMEIDGISLERPYTAFIVNQYWDATTGRTLQSQDINWLLGLWNGQVSHFAEGWVTSTRPTADLEVPYLVDTVGTEEYSTAFINGGNWTLDPAPIGVPGGLAIGGAGMFPAEVSDADVSEIVIFNRALETAELSSMRTYLMDKYSIDAFEDNPNALDPENIPDPDVMQILNGSVTTFQSATDLDFTGDFAYGINLGGPGENDNFDPLVIGDVELVAGTNADEPDLNDIGATITVANEIGNWFAATLDAFGEGTEDDDNLAFALQSIRWNVPPGVDIALDVEEGQSYKLQLLMGEACCDRGFDVTLEDELMVDNLIVHDLQDEGINDGSSAVAFTHEFKAGDDELNINLGGFVFGTPDNNPILHVLTLERIEDIGPVCNANSGGDLDGNGKVEFADFLVLSGNFGNEVGDHADGDIDCNGKVEFADFLVLSGNFGKEIAGTQSVPEPSGHVLLMMAGLVGMLIRRRR